MTPDIADSLKTRALELLRVFACPDERADWGVRPISGCFGLSQDPSEPDLYGMIDAVYVLHIIGALESRTTRESRVHWATDILRCQDEEGWFTLRNLRGHGREHATAYAVGALRLLEVDIGECHVERLRPINGISPLLRDEAALAEWLRRLGYEGLAGLRQKKVGWQHVWRSSHLAGVPATLSMLEDLTESWWPEADLATWFCWLFDWLDSAVSPETGLWQRAVWNRVYKRPTLIDLGGAAHFHWIYVTRNRPIPHPEKVIASVARLQRPTGLYSHQPFCIDLDANFCLTRSLRQLTPGERAGMEDTVNSAVRGNIDAIAEFFGTGEVRGLYTSLHDPPGALAAIAEAKVLRDPAISNSLSGWQDVFERVAWL